MAMAPGAAIAFSRAAVTAPASVFHTRIWPIRCSSRSLMMNSRGIQCKFAHRVMASSSSEGEESSVATLEQSDAAAADENASEGAASQEVVDEIVSEISPAESSVEEEKPRVVYPKGFTRYETMVVLRPDIAEEQRLQLSQRYEEMIIAGGAMDVEIFNRGIMPLAYGILKTNSRGEKNTYVDGIYYMFTYATKPGSIKAVQKKLETDDDIIRVTTFKIKY